MRRGRQLSFALPPRRGRPRKRVGQHLGHRPRPALASKFPVHVTMKVRPGAPYLRRRVCFQTIRGAFVAGKTKAGFRLVHFTVQGNHLHLICEAADKERLARGLQGLAIRVAKRLNAKLGRRGKLFAQRYHARILRTPSEVRNALVYVLNNARRHDLRVAWDWVDPLTSAAFFDGWRLPYRDPRARDGPAPVVPAGTWLLATGWRFRGLIAFDEIGREHAS
jgi:REP element-mobilizing transposase RayT